MQIEKNIIPEDASKDDPSERIISAGCGKHTSVIIQDIGDTFMWGKSTVPR